MAVKDSMILEPLVPNPDGTGNVVRLGELPRYDTKGDKAKIVFTFIDLEDDEMGFRHNQTDPLESTNAKGRDLGLSRVLGLYGALMTKENYEKVKAYNIDEDEDSQKFVAFANKLIDKDIFKKDLTILVGYGVRDQRYLSFPGIQACISSEFKKKKLAWTFESGIRLVQVDTGAATPDTEKSSGGRDSEM